MELPADAALGLIEPEPADPLWWLSFCDTGSPQGDQFLGAVIVQAPTLPAAVTRSHVLGVNPGGQVAVLGPMPARIGPEWRDRLLSKAEAESVPEPANVTPPGLQG